MAHQAIVGARQHRREFRVDPLNAKVAANEREPAWHSLQELAGKFWVKVDHGHGLCPCSDRPEI